MAVELGEAVELGMAVEIGMAVELLSNSFWSQVNPCKTFQIQIRKRII